MEIIASTSNYQKHLYFENSPNSSEYTLDRCMKVLAMIAKLKDRNQLICDMCENFYGRDSSGFIKTNECELKKYMGNLETILRLKRYYNFCLSRVLKFNFLKVNL